MYRRKTCHTTTHPGQIRRVPPHRSELGGEHAVEARPRVRVSETVAKQPLGLINKRAPTNTSIRKNGLKRGGSR